MFVIFLVPIASYADGRVRFNYRVAGSSSNPELGSKNVSSYTQADGSVATGADKLDSSSFSSFSLHYVSDYGLGFLGGGEILLGMYQFDTSYKTNITCTSVWITSGTAVCADGIALATRTASGTSRSLDVGYVYPIGDMSVGGGIALPVLGSSGETAVEWTALGNALSLRAVNGLGTTETLSPEGKSFSSYFLNFGYSIDVYEALLNYRSVSTSTSAPLTTTSGVGALLGGESELKSDSTFTSISIGVGYRF
ncbi:uncharacterized protein METZ01_LOCUS304123 [marine metagenome]|uniref:Outer membrane protein beta-barrel domain-containing protein n=1 Tax=marine metagenome TaxID=408172 RepID=A0A382MR24_9ZZZZ